MKEDPEHSTRRMKLDSRLQHELLQGSPDRFGYQWAAYAQIRPESREQLERWLGSTGLMSFRGLSVLDVGCGMGRNPYWMLRAGAASLTATDVDERSVAAAARNLAEFPNCRVVRESVYQLDPDIIGHYDRVTCIGVLHHLGDPSAALEKMWQCVQPGGDLILWCYGKAGNRLFLPAIQCLRFLGSRLPPIATHILSFLVTLIVWPLIRSIPWKTSYYRNLRQLSFGSLELILFDQLIPRISRYWTRDQIRALVSKLGGEVSCELVQGNSWHVRVVKTPQSQSDGKCSHPR